MLKLSFHMCLTNFFTDLSLLSGLHLGVVGWMCSVAHVTTLNSDVRFIEHTLEYFSTAAGAKFILYRSVKPKLSYSTTDAQTFVEFAQHEYIYAVFLFVCLF